MLHQGLAGSPNVFGLIPVEADPAQVLFEVLWAGVRVIGGAPVFLEQISGHDIDLLVRALGRQDGGDQQLQRVPKVEFTVGLRIGGCQETKNLLHSFSQFGLGFPRHPGELRTSPARVKQKSLHPFLPDPFYLAREAALTSAHLRPSGSCPDRGPGGNAGLEASEILQIAIGTAGRLKKSNEPLRRLPSPMLGMSIHKGQIGPLPVTVRGQVQPGPAPFRFPGKKAKGRVFDSIFMHIQE